MRNLMLLISSLIMVVCWLIIPQVLGFFVGQKKIFKDSFIDVPHRSIWRTIAILQFLSFFIYLLILNIILLFFIYFTDDMGMMSLKAILEGETMFVEGFFLIPVFFTVGLNSMGSLSFLPFIFPIGSIFVFGAVILETVRKKFKLADKIAYSFSAYIYGIPLLTLCLLSLLIVILNLDKFI